MTVIAVTNYHRALLAKVKTDLQNGTIQPERFDMAHFDWAGDCGTTHCIGGWMRRYAFEAGEELDGDLVTSFSSPFASLFYPTLSREEYVEISIQQAIVAIDLWLATGRVDWRAIMESVR